MIKGSKEVAVVLSDEQAAALRAEYPVEATFNRILLPRLGMFSQDKFEGKGKNAKLVQEAGMFYTEHQDDEVDEETGKKEWVKEECGNEIEAIILFQRKQLRYYDEGTQKYTLSPIYDSDEEIVPLFTDKVKVATDVPRNLKKMYPGLTRAGKPTSKLGEDRILYVWYNEEVYQLNLHGTSMYSFLDYARKTIIPTVLTRFNSEAKEVGSTNWNQMTFTAARKITSDEASVVIEKVREIKAGIAAEKAFFSKDATEESAVDKEWKALDERAK